MPCPECYNECSQVQTDACILYTGPDNETLGLCKGHTTLYELENIVVQRILSLMDGTGITLTPTSCAAVEALIGTDHTLKNLIQVLFTSICTLNTSVGALSTTVNQAASFNTSCLSGLPTNPTRDQVMQALLTKVCTINDRVTAIEGDYVRSTELNSRITSYLVSQKVTQQASKLVPYVAYEYYGPLSSFDLAGKGLEAAGFANIYLCNGQTVNGFKTPDKRGRITVGAVQGVPGGALDTEVDPATPGNLNVNYSLGGKSGKNFDKLSITQMPAHAHDITDTGHTHKLLVKGHHAEGEGNTYNDVEYDGNGAPAFEQKYFVTESSKTGIIIKSAGGAEPLDRRQPMIAANYIMYIPA